MFKQMILLLEEAQNSKAWLALGRFQAGLKLEIFSLFFG
jgi:hypothetical protein